MAESEGTPCRVNPMDVVRINLQEKVVVQLKGNRTLAGVLCGYDQHLNLLLRGVHETVHDDGGAIVRERDMPLLFIRGDTVVMLASARRTPAAGLTS